MATIRPDDLPAASTVSNTDAFVVDRGSAVQKATPSQIVDAAIPLASQAEAEAGTDNAKRVTPLRVAQAISARMIDINRLGEISIVVPEFDDASSFDIPSISVESFIQDRLARFKRVDAEPAHELKFNNGGWWEISEPVLWDFMGGSDNGALQRVLNAAAILGIRQVNAIGSYTLSSLLTIPDGIELNGSARRLTLTQANAANLTSVVSLGDNAKIRDAILDGNSANNDLDDTNALLRIGGSDNVKVTGCLIRNAPSFGLVMNGGLSSVITDNDFENIYSYGVASFGALTIDADILVLGNRFRQMGGGAAVFQSTRKATFSKNFVKNILTGAPGSRVTVTTSGTTVTMVSGSTANIIPGMWMTIDNGKEYRIASVVSSTQFTTTTAPPALTNVPAMMGTGDLIGNVAAQEIVIEGNQMEGTVTFGGGFSLASDGTTSGRSLVTGNIFKRCGKQGFNVAGEITGDTLVGDVRDISIEGNYFIDVGCGAGIADSDKIAVYVTSSAGKVYNIHVTSNDFYSTMLFGDNDGRSTYYLGAETSLDAGEIKESGNNTFGMLNAGVFNAIKTLTLTSDWGSTATKTILSQNGDSVLFTVACSGTFSASGLGGRIEVSKIVTKPGAKPVVNAKIVATNFTNGANLFQMFNEDQSTQSIWVSNINTTPANGQSYTISMKA